MSKVFNSFDDVNQALEAYIPTAGVRGAYRLDRMRPLMEALGSPQHHFRAIHVAGTSGKTSTCYYIASLLGRSGAKVGLTVSPHVNEVNERVQINLTPLPEAVYCALFGEFMACIESTAVRPTYFELLVAFAYWIFAKEQVDYAVIEVGLGGLLDSTNVITRSDKVCVLTDIGMDHTEILGRTLPEITTQKAGIIRRHNTVFMYRQHEPVMRVVREVCEGQQAELHEIVQPTSKMPDSKLPLFQQRNYYLAQMVADYMLGGKHHDFSDKGLEEASKLAIPGRMEIVGFGSKTIILDGAHNAQKMSAFIESLQARFPGKPFAAMVAMKRSRAAHFYNVMQTICSAASHLFLTSLDADTEYKTMSPTTPTKMAEACHLLGYDDWDIATDPQAALAALLSRPEDILVVTGSFYLVGRIRTLLHIST